MHTGKARRAPKEGTNGRAAGRAAAAAPRLKLNSEQEAAVKIDASVLVLSGAGTGKTRVITERIRHLIAGRAARPERILALTFTNKAAREMRQRLVGIDSRDMFVGTFHSFGLRILRRFHEEAGLPADFGVIDGGDQFSIVKQLLAEHRVPGVADKPNPGDIRHVIRDLQNRKDDRLDLSAILGHGRRIYDTHIRDPRALDDFLEAYETRLEAERKVDFQDLIIRACELIQQNATVRKALAGAYDHILIDELQDISADQLLMIGLLRARRTQYFGVGDDNQSIYRFRGANPSYMRYFRREFTANRTTALTTNYRSKSEILELANAVISRTRSPLFKSKRLRAHAGDGGAKPVLTGYENDQNEAQGVCDKVCALLGDGVRADEICVLYRNHALSSLIEQAFHQRKVPFRIRGGMRFFERREVKDLLAYLHAAVNPNGREAVMRSINNPPRKIGEKMKRVLLEEAEASGAGLWETLAASEHKGVREYVGVVEQIRAAGGLIDQVKEAVTRSGLREHLQRQKDKERAENLNEVVNAAVRYGEAGDGGLAGFLDSVALEAETDADGAKVAMMTIHAAKGLEYEHVFIIGINTGILPRYESQNDDVEEDRRLLYVAITRAKELAYLSYANTRMVFGSQQDTKLSFYLSGLEEYMDVQWGESAEMLTDDDRAEVNGSSFTVKDAVRSKKFGPGLILEISGNG
ncbi:MAG: ATP-dependent helicase, partial [Betaproteobacteria bacterium AqS2]|nr:ATP-dependent helicase [Betaproteobacteria bacterium AqS2]